MTCDTVCQPHMPTVSLYSFYMISRVKVTSFFVIFLCSNTFLYPALVVKYAFPFSTTRFTGTVWLSPLGINPMLPSYAKWHHQAWPTVVKVKACCLTAPSHYLDWCWLTISEVLWHLPKGNVTGKAQVSEWLSLAVFFRHHLQVASNFKKKGMKNIHKKWGQQSSWLVIDDSNSTSLYIVLT